MYSVLFFSLAACYVCVCCVCFVYLFFYFFSHSLFSLYLFFFTSFVCCFFSLSFFVFLSCIFFRLPTGYYLFTVWCLFLHFFNSCFLHVFFTFRIERNDFKCWLPCRTFMHGIASHRSKINVRVEYVWVLCSFVSFEKLECTL